MIVYRNFVSLCHLLVPKDIVQTTILAEEREMADWLIRHIPQTTEQFLLRSDADGVEAKK